MTFEEGGAVGLVFDGAACTACGECERLCPERAIRLRRDDIGRASDVPVRVTRHARRECARCGDPFVARAGESMCLSCQRSDGLASAGFALVTGARRVPPAPVRSGIGEGGVP
jgi:ferredoxin